MTKTEDYDNVDNQEVYEAIDVALQGLGLINMGGGDEDVNGKNGISTVYELHDYNVKVIIINEGE